MPLDLEKRRGRDRHRYRYNPIRRAYSLQRSKDWKLKHPDLKKHVILTRTYGMSLELYRKMQLEQNHVCAICKGAETMVRNGTRCDLSVDHCHKTGRVRGLLCNNCNRAMGLLKDDIKVIQATLDYLKSHEQIA